MKLKLILEIDVYLFQSNIGVSSYSLFACYLIIYLFFCHHSCAHYSNHSNVLSCGTQKHKVRTFQAQLK